jgi:tRNA(Arg) A34 adenosine deaminase TadA
MDTTDQRLLRETFRIALRAREQGDRPFGALLAGPEREVLLEAHDDVVTGRHRLGHAASNVLREACSRFPRELLERCTLYASTEPCAMCAGAIFWSGVRRVLFGLSTAKLAELAAGRACRRELTIPCRGVLALGRPLTEVTGPVLQAEASEAHKGYWDQRRVGKRSGLTRAP